jgi:hypothetical protein
MRLFAGYILAGLFLGTAFLPVQVKAQAVYTFDSLNTNYLNGQDNWFDQTGAGIAEVYIDTTAVNGTRIASPVLSIFYQPAFVIRPIVAFITTV